MNAISSMVTGSHLSSLHFGGKPAVLQQSYFRIAVIHMFSFTLVTCHDRLQSLV